MIDNPIIDTNIIKQCHIEAIKHIVDNLSSTKDTRQKINNYSKDYEYYPDI